MWKRTFQLFWFWLLSFSMTAAWAFSLNDLSGREAAGGLKEALGQGVVRAVENLGKVDGFLGNPKVRIPLPEGLREVESLMRGLGMGKQADELIVAMNRAAEAAIPEARGLLVKAVKEMTIEDAKAILAGGDDAATQYFKRKSQGTLTEKFLPIARRAVEKVRLAQAYEKFAGHAARFGIVKDVKLERYIAEKALDGLYAMIAEEERAIRQNPGAAAGNLAKKVFGLLQ